MELGAGLELNGDILRVVPRNDIYVRYLNDNKSTIATLASEHYGRPIKVELAQPAPAAENPAPSQPAAPETPAKRSVPRRLRRRPPPNRFPGAAMANAAPAPEAAASNGEPIDRETRARNSSPIRSCARFSMSSKGGWWMCGGRRSGATDPNNAAGLIGSTVNIIATKELLRGPTQFVELLQQAQALQEKLKQLQEEAASKTVEAQSGGGMVRVTVDGAMQVRRIRDRPLADDRQRQGDARRPDYRGGQRGLAPGAEPWSPRKWASWRRWVGLKFPGFE